MFRHWVWVVIAVVGLVGTGATLFGAFVVPRWVWWGIFGIGVLVAQFRAYADLAEELGRARARLGEPTTDDNRRSWLRDQRDYASALRDEVLTTSNADWFQHRQQLRIGDALDHWEKEVITYLRRHFAGRADDLFVSADDGSGDTWNPKHDEPGLVAAYIDRRIARLRELDRSLT